MKLKTRIIISFFIIILVPVCLASVAFYGFTKFKIRSIQEQYGIEGVAYDTLSSNLTLLNKMTQRIYDSIQKEVQANPEAFVNPDYLSEINRKLVNQYSYLVARRENQVYFCGSSVEIVPQEELPAYGDSRAGSDSGIYMGEQTQAFVKQIDFEFADGAQGSLFIVSRADTVIPQVKTLVSDMIVIIILILVGTSLCLSLWIYKGIVTPLNHLKEATRNIKEGNLDFTIEASEVEEINDLCVDFEDMRRRLKDSAEEKLAFDKENKELISNISHDLKTPITAVKGYVEGIMDGVADTPEKMDRYIRTIYNKANEMDRLINELTFYSKIDTNRIPYTFNKIYVSEYFEDCVEELSLELEAKGVELTYTNYVDEDVMVIADAEQLTRVINNIVSNSLKYMDKQVGKIAIRICNDGDFIHVEIEDNGKGISQKDLTSIFERFYRTDASRNSSKGGSGIGLSIVRKILEDHGGKVWATSKLGVGTTMHFVLRKYQEVPINE